MNRRFKSIGILTFSVNLTNFVCLVKYNVKKKNKEGDKNEYTRKTQI